MRIAIASDHAGFLQKAPLAEYLSSQGHEVVDCGPATDARCDYPDFGEAAARAVGEKSVSMIHVKDITSVTGYVRGGCSPVGMKKQYKTVFDLSCLAQPTILVSAGRIGAQIEAAPADLIAAVRGATAPITAEAPV